MRELYTIIAIMFCGYGVVYAPEGWKAFLSQVESYELARIDRWEQAEAIANAQKVAELPALLEQLYGHN